MSNDVIHHATTGHIMASEENLDLALQVEAAMPQVREILIEGVLKGVKEHFSKKDALLLIRRRKSWLKSANDNETGIQLAAGRIKGQINWGSVYIGLYLSEKLTKKIEGQPVLNEELTELSSEEPKHRRDRYWPMWNLLKNCDCSNILRDWSKEEFCKKALNAPEQLADELTALVKEWADMKKTKRILSVVERSCTEYTE